MIFNKLEHTEKGEGVRSPDNTIYDGDWKLNIYTNSISSGFGMRRYHKHGDNWYTVKTMDEEGWACAKCGMNVPDTMEGYINLARWAGNDN